MPVTPWRNRARWLRLAPGNSSHAPQEEIPVRMFVLWLLGVPLGILIVLKLFGVL